MCGYRAWVCCRTDRAEEEAKLTRSVKAHLVATNGYRTNDSGCVMGPALAQSPRSPADG